MAKSKKQKRGSKKRAPISRKRLRTKEKIKINRLKKQKQIGSGLRSDSAQKRKIPKKNSRRISRKGTRRAGRKGTKRDTRKGIRDAHRKAKRIRTIEEWEDVYDDALDFEYEEVVSSADYGDNE